MNLATTYQVEMANKKMHPFRRYKILRLKRKISALTEKLNSLNLDSIDRLNIHWWMDAYGKYYKYKFEIQQSEQRLYALENGF